MITLSWLPFAMLAGAVISYSPDNKEDDHYYQSLRGCGQIEAEGTYCWGGNQEWYVDCIYHPRVWDFYSGAINWIKCPKGTRCSCFKDTECSGPKSEICKRPEVFPSWPSKFHLTFEKKFIFDNDVWIDEESDKPKLLVGSIKQDLSMGKVLYIENGTNVLVQKENSSFVKYTWKTSTNEECTKSNVDKLQSFMPELLHYQLLETKMDDSNDGSNQELRAYYHQEGPLNSWAFESYRYWWTMRYDQTTGTMLPVSYKYRYADVDLSDRKAYDDFIYETVTGANDKDTDTSDWFQLPKKCNK